MKFWTKQEPNWLSKNDVEKKFEELEKSWTMPSNLIKLKNNIIKLIDDNFVDKQRLEFLPVITQINRKNFNNFLNRRDYYLENNEKLSKEQFYTLFWNLKKTKSNNKTYSTWKYNKSDFHQWWTWECVLLSWLEILKKTPFFETMIRCSLKRNENNDWWLILLPLCNKKWEFKEVKDDEILYLKKSYFTNWRGVISDSSLWFNILETIFLKEYFHKMNKLDFDKFNELSYDLINEKISWYSLYSEVANIFLWEEAVVWVDYIPVRSNTSDDTLKFMLKLSKTWIIKLWCNLKIPRDYKYTNKPVKTINTTRWYTVNVYWEDDSFLYGIDEINRSCFSPKWCNEWFIRWHQYSIEKLFSKDNETHVVIINPWFTEKKLTVSLKQFKEIIQVFNVIAFDIEKMFKENKE